MAMAMGRARGIHALAALLALILFGSPVGAANPEVTAEVRGVEGREAQSDVLSVETLDIAVRVHGAIAQTEITVGLRNRGKDRLEGRFKLQMPHGSVVTGYALDVGGAMVEGVLLDQLQARRAYQARVRGDIDPGLGEVSRAFEFTTQVYPIDPGARRTVRLRFVTPLEIGKNYVLPLEGDSPVGRLTVSVSLPSAAGPGVQLPGTGAGRWSPEGDGRRLQWEVEQAVPKGALTVPFVAERMAIGGGPEAERFFEIVDSAPLSAGADTAPKPRSVAILWDRSLSRRDDALKAEIALLRAWIDAVRPRSIDLLLFDASRVERVRVSDGQGVEDRLKGQVYRGATSFAGLAREGIRADACLLFSDGLVTIDRRQSLRPACRLDAVSSAADADMSGLSILSAGLGGDALRLTATNHADILSRLLRPGARVLRVRSTVGADIDAVALEAPAGGWRLVGPVPETGGVVVTLAGLGAEPEDRLYARPDAQGHWSGASALWAAQRLAARSAAGESRAALVGFARRYSVAGPAISFLVLETAEDYAREKIAPPPGLPEEEIGKYRTLVAEAEAEEAQMRGARLEEVLAAWEKEKTWWKTPFNPNAPAHRKSNEKGGIPEMAPLPPEPTPPPPGDALNDLPSLRSTFADQSTITGSRVPQPNLASQTPITAVSAQDIAVRPTADSAISIAPWASDRPYMKLLKAAPPAARNSVFAEQEALHGHLPAFWFDVAELSWNSGDKEEARRRLHSSLELPARNNETLAIVAQRLLRYGDADRAIELFEAVAAAEPERPQPLMNLALALAKRGQGAVPKPGLADLARAIDLLTQVIMTPWSGDYDGIELVALMDVNRLIARYRAAGGSKVPLDPRLVALLDVDLRVVIEWNTEETDLDLWVDEPNGERAMYDNMETNIGGRISNDMIEGYGPEEYLLRRAPSGTFTVRADVFSSDAINPNGASRITARLIRNFGRPDEEEREVEVELIPVSEGRNGDDDDVEDGDVRLIGRLRVPR